MLETIRLMSLTTLPGSNTLSTLPVVLVSTGLLFGSSAAMLSLMSRFAAKG